MKVRLKKWKTLSQLFLSTTLLSPAVRAQAVLSEKWCCAAHLFHFIWCKFETEDCKQMRLFCWEWRNASNAIYLSALTPFNGVIVTLKWQREKISPRLSSFPRIQTDDFETSWKRSANTVSSEQCDKRRKEINLAPLSETAGDASSVKIQPLVLNYVLKH